MPKYSEYHVSKTGCSIQVNKAYVHSQDARRRSKLRRAYHVTVNTVSPLSWESFGTARTKAEANRIARRASAETGCPLHPRWGKV